jgi:hypothetical protein
MNLLQIALIGYWVPAYLIMLYYSFMIRHELRREKTQQYCHSDRKMLTGKMTQSQKLAEALVYCSIVFAGVFMIPEILKAIKRRELP